MNIEHHKEKLIAKRDDLMATQATSAVDRAPVELDQSKVGRLSRMDALQGQAMSEAVEVRRKNEILQINNALLRIDEDEFGFCLSCGDEISKKRLELDPAAALCIGCAQGKPRF